MKTGKLYGVSVGLGDPELMTLKALTNIRRKNNEVCIRSHGCMLAEHRA